MQPTHTATPCICQHAPNSYGRSVAAEIDVRCACLHVCMTAVQTRSLRSEVADEDQGLAAQHPDLLVRRHQVAPVTAIEAAVVEVGVWCAHVHLHVSARGQSTCQ